MVDKKMNRCAGLPALMLVAVALLPVAVRPARATSLDGAGRIVILPYAVSGLERGHCAGRHGSVDVLVPRHDHGIRAAQHVETGRGGDGEAGGRHRSGWHRRADGQPVSGFGAEDLRRNPEFEREHAGQDENRDMVRRYRHGPIIAVNGLRATGG